MLKLGLIGAGRVSEVHMQAINGLESVEATAICDIDAARAAARGEAWGLEVFNSPGDLLANADIDAVLVLTHADSHIAIAEQALRAGKHVLVEKPVGPESSEIRMLDALARERGLVAMPGHNYAYLPEFARMQRLTRSGDLGDIRALFVTYVIKHPEDVARDYSGVLDEVMVHHAYLAASLLGEPDAVVAGAPTTGWSSVDQEDQAWMTLSYGKATFHGFATFGVDDHSSSPWTFIVKILGTKGSAVVDFRTAVFQRPLGTLNAAYVPYEESYGNELRAFAESIQESGGLISTMENAAVAADIIGACQVSRSEGRYVFRNDPGVQW
jgi:predicted dehydrogenase